MEYGSIEREIHIEATPQVVYDVVSRPEHVASWWPDRADYDPVVGGSGTITFGDPAGPDAKTEQLTVVETDPHRRFAFRWVYDAGTEPTADNSFLVTFDLEPVGSGTRLRMRETGFRERGWDVAVVEQCYRDHVSGWDHFLPRLEAYAGELAATA